jgi:AhpD family alkylhydroperoxidase
MKRIEGARSGLVARVALRLARRKTRQIAGAETEQMIEPLEAYAHLPLLTLGYGALEEATGRLHRVDHRVKVLAELKAATLTQCEYCIDIGSQIAARAGITEDQLLALPRYRDSELFGELEKLVLDYAVGMSSTPVAVSDELFAKLRARFDDAQIVELTNIIALENMRGRFNLALGIGSSGFREGLVCAVPDRAPAQDGSTARAGAAVGAAAGAGSVNTAA